MNSRRLLRNVQCCWVSLVLSLLLLLLLLLWKVSSASCLHISTINSFAAKWKTGYQTNNNVVNTHFNKSPVTKSQLSKNTTQTCCKKKWTDPPHGPDIQPSNHTNAVSQWHTDTRPTRIQLLLACTQLLGCVCVCVRVRFAARLQANDDMSNSRLRNGVAIFTNRQPDTNTQQCSAAATCGWVQHLLTWLEPSNWYYVFSTLRLPKYTCTYTPTCHLDISAQSNSKW